MCTGPRQTPEGLDDYIDIIVVMFASHILSQTQHKIARKLAIQPSR